MAKYINLTPSQKDEIRRLTQFANRRIKAAEKEYAKHGFDVLPREVVGGQQIKQKWATDRTPLSRSVRFDSEQAYKDHLSYLKSFKRERPTVGEYGKILKKKTTSAIDTTFGGLPPTIEEKISGLSAPELDMFWTTFSDKASRLGLRYSSTQAMFDTFEELYPEDVEHIV